MKKAVIFILLTIVLLFSLYELYNISALYNDQVSMSEILAGTSNQNVPQNKTSQLDDFKFELNSWRVFYITYIVFYVFYSAFMLYKTRKQVS